MKKAIKGGFAFVGMLCLLGGIFVATLEAEALSDQIGIYKYAFVLIVLGTLLCLLNGGEKNELDG